MNTQDLLLYIAQSYVHLDQTYTKQNGREMPVHSFINALIVRAFKHDFQGRLT